MPRATIGVTSQTFDLKSCEGGTVTLKRMTYGDSLKRRDMAMLMSFRSMSGASSQGEEMSTELQNRKVTEFEWSSCITSWNLTDENDQALDWNAPNILDVIDPAVGNEISDLITGMNDFAAELKN